MKIYIKLAIALIIVSIVLVGCGTNNKVYDSVNIEKSVINTVGEKNIVRSYFVFWVSDFVDKNPELKYIFDRCVSVSFGSEQLINGQRVWQIFYTLK